MNLDLKTIQAQLEKHITVLTKDIGDRSIYRPRQLTQAKDYIAQMFHDQGLSVTEQAYYYKGQKVANIIAHPKNRQNAKGYYLVGAHYDTVAGTPGADDNASGVAVLLETARLFVQNNRGKFVQFVAFTLEEPPAFQTSLQGSRYLARNARHQGEPILGAIVLEMVGYTSPSQEYPLPLLFSGYPKTGDFIGIIGNNNSRKLGKTVLRGFQKNRQLPVESLFVPLNGWILPATRLSDHASFWDNGYPAVMITDTAFMRNPNYHTPNDEKETLNFHFMSQLVISLQYALSALL